MKENHKENQLSFSLRESNFTNHFMKENHDSETNQLSFPFLC